MTCIDVNVKIKNLSQHPLIDTLRSCYEYAIHILISITLMKYNYRIDKYACFINIEVPHEVKYQRTLATRPSQKMKNGQDVTIQMRSGAKCSR